MDIYSVAHTQDSDTLEQTDSATHTFTLNLSNYWCNAMLSITVLITKPAGRHLRLGASDWWSFAKENFSYNQ